MTASTTKSPSMLNRMTAILDAFDTSYRCRSLQEISLVADLPRSTTHRILDQLVRLGWVEHRVAGYRLGWRANHLSARSDENARLRQAGAQHIHDLAVCSQLIVHLAVLDGPFVHYLDKVGGGGARSVPTRVGGSVPAHLTAVGKSMLAYIGPEELEAVLNRVEVATDPDVSPSALHQELAAIRVRRGLAFSINGPLAAVSCVGAPIFDAEERIIGGLSLCDGGSGVPLDNLVPLLRERARRISTQLPHMPSAARSAGPDVESGLLV